MKTTEIIMKSIKEPTTFPDVAPVFLTDETIHERKAALLTRMKEESFDTLIIYADKEHGSNFEYLTGFIPRFEEALLIVESNGKCTVILGNENVKMAKFSRISVELIHSPLFSLPNQPMDNEKMLETIFEECGLTKKEKIGLIGWKLFTTQMCNSAELFDLPYFIVQALKHSIDRTKLHNACHLMISEGGVRTVNNANEIVHYEYGANLASNCILKAMNEIAVGKKESELGAFLTAEGQYNSVVTIAASGQRFEKANFYPTHKKIQLGDPLSLTVGYKGGLSSRTGFIVETAEQLPIEQSDYLDRVAKPYFKAIICWLEEVKIGMKGNEVYQMIESVLPKKTYHWHLNPGHLVSDEEWLASPIYDGSNQLLKNGMIFQIDIIPSVTNYSGVSAEECVALADEELQQSLKRNYPDFWNRISIRRSYLQEELNIALSKDIIPLSNTVAYMRPFFLNKKTALTVRKNA